MPLVIAPPAILAMSAQRFLQSLADRSAAMVVLDPPSRLGVGESEDESEVEEQIAALRPIADQVHRVLQPGGASVMMGEPQVVAAWELAACRAGLRFMAEMIVLWDETDGAHSDIASLTTAVRWHMRPGPRHSFHPRRRISLDSNVMTCHRVPVCDRMSPTQRPVELFNHLVTMLTDEGDLVVDPYCGTGSALVAAKMNDRRWVGADLNPDMVSIAIKRITRPIELEEHDLRPFHLWTGEQLIQVEG